MFFRVDRSIKLKMASKSKRSVEVKNKKKRSVNITNEEVEILLDEVHKRKGILFSKLTNTITNQIKIKSWQEITTKINAVSDSSAERTCAQMRKKWADLASHVKIDEAERRRHAGGTGGGPARGKPKTPRDERILAIIGRWHRHSIKLQRISLILMYIYAYMHSN